LSIVRGKENVMPSYIRVSVVLSQSLCRKEREKLDINLDRHSFGLQSLGNLVISYYFKVYKNHLGPSGMFECHTLGLELSLWLKAVRIFPQWLLFCYPG
jgi:hypothetical protein